MDRQSAVAELAPPRALLRCQGRDRPVFVDSTGRRARVLRHVGAVADLLLLGYLGILALGFAGGTPLAPETLVPGKDVATASGTAAKGSRGGKPSAASHRKAPVGGSGTTALPALGPVRPDLR
ncbi:hypothetical protein [Streptomyces sp. 8N706]|uniref:hypothetical protein n=1 Tax=Streptomyces sp. 8N706 TaxID=3457416 RepID=UPI003FD03790